MRSTVILDHPGPDWGKSQPCLRASPILFSYPDTLMPVMHGKQSGPVDIILTWSCVNNSVWLRGGLRRQSHTLNARDTVLAFMNPCVWLTELCSKKASGNHSVCISKKASLKWSNYNANSCVYTTFMSVCVYTLAWRVHVWMCLYFFPLCQHSGLTESCKVKGQGNITGCLFGAFPPVALSLWLTIRAADWDALTAPLSHHQRGAEADWWPGQARGAGWWGVAANHKKKKRKKQCVCESTVRMWVCMHVRVEERDAFGSSCLSPSMTCRSEASCWLGYAAASATFFLI